MSCFCQSFSIDCKVFMQWSIDVSLSDVCVFCFLNTKCSLNEFFLSVILYWLSGFHAMNHRRVFEMYCTVCGWWSLARWCMIFLVLCCVWIPVWMITVVILLMIRHATCLEKQCHACVSRSDHHLFLFEEYNSSVPNISDPNIQLHRFPGNRTQKLTHKN